MCSFFGYCSDRW